MPWAAAAAVVGSAISSDSAKSSARKQAKALEGSADVASSEQRRQFDVTQANLAPFQSAGEAALNQQRILLGLGSQIDETQAQQAASDRFDLQNQIDLISTEEFQPGSTAMARRGDNARRESFEADKAARIQDLELQLANTSSVSQVQREAGGLTAAEQQQQAFDALDQSPGQQFLRDRAQKNLLRNTSAIGGLGGGNVRSALVQQGVGFAQQDLQNQFGRLGQLAGQGQAAVTNLGQFGQQTAQNIGNLALSAGQARATGLQQQNQANQQFISGVGTALGQSGIFNQNQSNQNLGASNIDPFARTA